MYITLNLVCLVSVAIVTMLGTPALGTETVAQALDWARVSVTWENTVRENLNKTCSIQVAVNFYLLFIF